MSRNIYEPTTERQVAANSSRITRVRQRPGAFRWWTPDCDTGSGDDLCTGEEPVLENSWAQPSAPLERFSFRLHTDGSLEFKGHLDSSGGAVSGSVAVTLPGANSGEVDFRPANDQYFHTTITVDDGASFTLALVFVDATTGEVTITWPAS